MTLMCNPAISLFCLHSDVLLFIIVADDYVHFQVLADDSTSQIIGSLLNFNHSGSDDTHSPQHQVDLAVVLYFIFSSSRCFDTFYTA